MHLNSIIYYKWAKEKILIIGLVCVNPHFSCIFLLDGETCFLYCEKLIFEKDFRVIIYFWNKNKIKMKTLSIIPRNEK